MRIINDFSYMDRKGINNEIEELGIFHLRFSVQNPSDSEKIMDLLEKNFKVYQYNDLTEERYKESELFFWSNKGITGRFDYFTITFKEGAISKNYEKIDKLLMLLNDSFLNCEFEVAIQYTAMIDPERVSNYIQNCKFEINTLDIPSLGFIESHIYLYRTLELSPEIKDKLRELSSFIKKSLEGKRINFNGMIGTVKKISESEYGFFKLRAKTRYYRFELNTTKSISF